MKKFTSTLLMILLFSTISNAQDSFKDLWVKVEKLEVDNLPKSALKIVEKIYTKAEKENNAAQLVKTLFYKSKFSLTLEEDAQLKIINSFKKHISKSKFPTKNVLENVLANLYWQYFTQNRYKFYNRTKTEKKVAINDFRTWDINTLFEEIHTYFNASLENSKQLQKINVHNFSDILSIQKDSKKYRPTLYDFLANNALTFYKSSETSITRPSYKFILDNKNYLSDYKTFSKLNITTKDNLSLQFNALKIYQKIIRFHLNENNLDALVDIDIHRVNFVNQHATFNDKNDVYKSTLKLSKKSLNKKEVSGLYAYEIGKLYRSKADSYHVNKEEKNRFKNKEAIAICNAIIKQFPESLGAKKCSSLKSQINQKNISITAEEYIPIDKNSRLLVNYKNIDRLCFSGFKVSKEQLSIFNKTYNDNEKITFINSLEKVKNWEANLRNEEDFLQHTTEVVVPKFKQGNYLIVASESEDLSSKKIYGTTAIQVTNLTLVQNNFDYKTNYQIVDRNNGKPIENATIHLKNEKRYRGPAINKKRITDKNGFASFNIKEYYRNVAISVATKDDNATFGNHYLYYRKKYNNKKDGKLTVKPFIFMDRSIYRPGQTVYFKTIVVAKKGEASKVFENESVEISLKDVNNQIVKTLNLKLNEYGSASGEFILPNNGLTGQYSIMVSKSAKNNIFFNPNQSYFSVEEYKRPKFKTEFKAVTESYKINDSITINGFAKAFSGANITDGKVVYRVHRKVQYPRWCYWRMPNLSSNSQEITYGESSTNEKGEFEIKFKAIPDESVSKENLPVFTYEITADVTDVNGESRSATSNVRIGYHSLLATISINNTIDKNTKQNKLTIDTKNLNNEFISAKGTVKIYKLKAPKNALRKRPWNSPDYQDISENTFRNLFPNDPYSENESDAKNWGKGELVFNTNFDTQKTKEILLKNTKNWVSGKYIVILESKDKFGQVVKDEQRFSVFSNNEKTVADNALFTINTDKPTYKVGENVALQIGSASKDIIIVLQIEKNHSIVKTELIKINNVTKIIKIPVNNEDLGGFAVKYHYVNYNEFNSGNLLINVPEIEESNITIETNVFRDKLQPGQNETWSFSVKNDKNDKATAEVLASMYDASLDEFKSHHWNFNPIAPKATYHSYSRSNANHSFKNTNFRIINNRRNNSSFPTISYDRYNWFGFRFGSNRNYSLMARSTKSNSSMPMPMELEEIVIVEDAIEGKVAGVNITDKAKTSITIRGNASISKDNQPLVIVDGVIVKSDFLENLDMKNVTSFEVLKDGIYGTKGKNGVILITTKKSLENQLSKLKARKNFKETAFFFPELRTDKNGKVSFNFTMPEALTRWKLQLLAHTKGLKSATKTLQTVTQKELMVVPNVPRFLREGDKITLSAKITNLTNNKLSGVSKLILTDAITGKNITKKLLSKMSSLPSGEMSGTDRVGFSVDKDGNTNVSWSLSIPETAQAVQYKIVAKAGAFSDGEQNVLPVLSNRMLVTETLPMWVRSNQTKTFTLDKLKNNTSSTLKNHKLTLEMTSNPVWYAIQSLPYLMEYPYDCAEQTFSKYYANTLASFVANSNPRIQEVFNAWKSSGALLSNLEKNQELKSLIIQETPWLRNAQSETEQKKRIALLFDLNKMKNEQERAINKLKDIQMNSGGFPWFKGGRLESTFITQHIATGFGHLQKLGVTDFNPSTKNMIQKSVNYLDRELLKQYEKLQERANEIREREQTKKKGEEAYKKYLSKNHLGHFTIQYLYMRSFYKDISLDGKTTNAIDYYRNQTIKYWNDYNLYAKGQIALSLFRNDETITANKILKSLKENSITTDELGMYWKSNTAGYYYYQAPIETQALLIETFSEIENDTKTIDNLKIWLLKNKQTNRWKTTKATTEAVYALLLNGSDWVSVTEMVDIKVGGKKIDPSTLENVKVEAGTGYFKTSWNANEITPKMSEVNINKKGNGIAWGGLYWQYFEDLDKITSMETPLKLNKKLFLKVNSDKGKKLLEISDKTKLKVGDLITVRIELRSDRNMEFIHMKDMRASGVEPINVLSKYKWQDNLGYYESTKDAATNFFFDRLPKGIYVFEYDVRVNNAGNFSNGITTIQSMYAPEFSSHSSGVRIEVLEK